MKIKNPFFVVIIFMCLILISSTFAQTNKLRDNYQLPQLPRIGSGPMDPTSTVIKGDFMLTLRDSVQLDCSKFYPSEHNLNWKNGFPCVIMCHGYGDRKETLEQFAHDQASYGYVVYTYSMRGQGNSGGLSNLISITEAQDLIEFVNYVKHDTVTWLDSSKVLIMGGSQGALIPYMAACNGMKVNSIISALGSPEFASSWIENGSIKMTFLWTIGYTPDTARYTPLVTRMSDWVYATGGVSDKWDSLAYYVPLNRDFKNKVSSNQVPMLIENSWQDYFFNARQSIEGLSLLQPFYRTYYGAVMGHGGDTSGVENIWHMNFFNEWFFYYLWGIDNGIITRPRYHYAFTTSPTNSKGMWSFSHDSTTVWPPSTTNMKLYFNENKKLTSKQVSDNNIKIDLKNDVKKNYTLQNAVNDEFTGKTFAEGFKVASIYFETVPLTSKLKMIGTPTINLDYSSDANICQYNFQIFEVFSNGIQKLVTRVNYTDRKYTKNLRKAKLINGNAHAHIFQSGSKIRVVVTNLDWTPNDSLFLGTNPFALPVMTSSNNSVYLRNTCINIPVMSSQNSLIVLKNELPEKMLYQNFPNPFNPTTTIQFKVPDNYSSNVTLKIYNLVGREVAILINQNLTSGIHEVIWDATNIASGVYFYKITAWNVSEVKKMTIIK
ncbi:MAG TPA: alpha/beta fold hydrolase [Ignavibacteria bacterium]